MPAVWNKSVNLIDVEFSKLDLDAAVDAIAAQASLNAPFAYVVTPNVDHVVGLDKEPGRRALYENAWVTLNDSRVLEALASSAGLHVPAATGSDVAQSLFDDVIERHEPITIIGGDEDMIRELKHKYGLTDVRWHNPPKHLRKRPDAIVAAAAFAAAQRARFTFICVGAPQQEMIAYAMKQQGDAVGVGLCFGAALEFLTGRKQRAPLWMRRARLEWAHRLGSEPRRLWRRYLVDGPKVFSLFSEWRAAMAAASAA